MKRFPIGPLMVFSGIVGGGLLWLVLCGLRFDYLVSEVYNGSSPGEAIWALDPIFTIAAALPGGLLVFAGFFVSLQTPEYFKRKEQSTEMSQNLRTYRYQNLFYLGNIVLIIPLVTSFLGLVSSSGSLLEGVIFSSIIMATILITCIISLVYHVYLTIRSDRIELQSSILSRSVVILLIIELTALFAITYLFRLDRWSLIELTTIVIVSSGVLGLLLQIPSIFKYQEK